MAVAIDSASIRLIVACKATNALDLSTPEDDLRVTFSTTFTSGTGASQFNRPWHDTRSINSASSEDLDFAGGVTDAFGNTVTFTALKAIIISAKSTNTTNLTVSRPASNGLVLFGAASDALAVLTPGSLFAFTDVSAAGLTVTANTGDLLTITNSTGAAASYDIVVFGEA